VTPERLEELELRHVERNVRDEQSTPPLPPAFGLTPISALRPHRRRLKQNSCHTDHADAGGHDLRVSTPAGRHRRRHAASADAQTWCEAARVTQRLRAHEGG
jgi:hypothetical protein